MSNGNALIPRFIGSNLKNLFLPFGLAREVRETKSLYKKARTTFRRSGLSDRDARERYIVNLVFNACKRADRFPAQVLLCAICDLAEDLLTLEGVAELPELRSINALSIEDAFALRQRLMRVQRFTDSAGPSEAWCGRVTAVTRSILDTLPGSVFDDGGDKNGADPLSSLFVPLIDLCDEPAAVVECTIAALCEHDATAAHLFEAVRDRLEHNLRAASGVPHERLRDANRRSVPPTSYRARSNEELVSVYLSGTPFRAFFGAPVPLRIPFPARFEHTHIVGGSGHGKTQLMQLLIYHDLLRARADGRSVIVIDSQGDLIRTVSGLALFRPGERDGLAERLVIIDPNDIEYPACLNMFDWNRERVTQYGALEREKLLNSTVELYEYFFGALLGAELTQRQGVIFRYLARLMMEIPNATIQTLRQLMENGEPFRPYMERLPGTARSFFETRFFDRSFNETKKQILTRLWGVLSNATLERMFSHPRNKVDIYESINSGKIIFINTAKELLKQEGCAIFGRFFISLIAQASVERASIAPHERRPTFLYIDEAQDYFDDSIEHLLNQARKYRVGMVLAHQNLDQLAAGLRASVMASTSIKLVGGISAKDARPFAEEMRCDWEYLLRAKKRDRETQFACHIRNLTPRAITVTVPLGFVESQPTLGPEERRILTEANRVRCAVSIEEAFRSLAPAADAARGGEDELPTGLASERTAPHSHPIGSPSVARPKAKGTGASTTAQLRRPRPTPTDVQAGRGGRQHTYLQHLLKGAAQERGYLAVIEAPVLDGAGKVDLLLSKNGRRIACEISVTTSKHWELGNLEKCLAAGYEEVILVMGDERQLKAMSKYIRGQLTEEALDRVRYCTPDAVIAHLDERDSGAPPTEETIRGYRVKVRRGTIDSGEVTARRQSIAAVLARSLKETS